MQAQNCHDFAELYQWSIQLRADFWQAAVAALQIKFQQKYRQILDLSEGVAKPNWLVGAKLNIIESCWQADTNAIAIVFADDKQQIQTITYGQLKILSARVANSLIKLGFVAGDAIAIDMVMTVEAVAIYLGIIQIGGIVVGIADSFAAAEVHKRLSIAKAKAIFTQDILLRAGKQHPLYEKIIDAELPLAIVVPRLAELNVKLRATDLSWQQFLVANSEFAAIACDPHAPINILFSSGTTAEPKAIVWDHTSAIKAAIDGYLYQDLKPGDRIAWPSSLGWMMGPWLIFATLINKATMALFYDAPNTLQFTEFVAKAQITVLGLVPSLIKNWRLHNYLAAVDWSQIKLFTSTGETSNPDDMQYLMQLTDAPVIEYCGGTEIAGAYITSTLLQDNLPGLFSTPVLGLDLKLLDENGKETDKGKIALVPPTMGLSRVLLNRDNYQVYYSGMPQTQDGVILRRHGDQMQRLANGYYRSLGRADDSMNLGGIKISAAEIEQCFVGMPQIVETAAIGLNRNDNPTELVIFVVATNAKNLDLQILQQKLQQAINQKLNPLFKISAVKIVEALPRTNSNKIMRRVLREQLREDT